MHPILVNTRRLFIYLTGWLLFSGMVGYMLTLAEILNWIEALAWLLPLGLINAFMGLGSWYFCRTFSLKKAVWGQQLITLGVATLFSSGLWVPLGMVWAKMLALAPGFEKLPEKVQPLNPLLFAMGVLLFALALAIHYLILAIEESKAAEQKVLEMHLLARESELKALKAQLHPHFLFNSLNSVSALTSSNPAAARQMCLQLADFLRKSLNYAGMDLITFGEEIELAGNYLAIEQIRFGSRLQVQKSIAEESCGCLFLPLLLQPLLENAINHGIGHLLEGGNINLEARCAGSKLKLSVENPCDPDRPKSNRAGYGLSLVRRRLEEFYGDQAWINYDDQGSSFQVRLTLPAEFSGKGIVQMEDKSKPSPRTA